jgi:hypothetical protein
MPATSFDTFFACIIIVAAALIATTFFTSTMETQINDTRDVNKDSYLHALADRIVANPGTPSNWGTSSGVPSDFGLAAASSTGAYTIDMDKITRLNNQNDQALSYFEMSNSSNLRNIAFGVALSQVMAVNVSYLGNLTVGSNTAVAFSVSTSIQSKPTPTSLHCYIIAHNYQTNVTSSISDNGTSTIGLIIPTAAKDSALMVVFARANFDPRLTAYAVYSFANQTQETTPGSSVFGLSPLDYTLSCNQTSQTSVGNGYALSYSQIQQLPSMQGSHCPIPQIDPHSPTVLVGCGSNNTAYLEEWTAYPQIPFTAGSNFNGSDRNVFSYTVTVDGVLYKLDITLGDLQS